MAKDAKLTNPKPVNLHLVAGAKDGVITSGNQILDTTKSTFNPDGSLNQVKTIQETIDTFDEAIENKQEKITETAKLSSDLVTDADKTNKFVTADEKTAWSGKYTKPSTGIPEEDLTALTREKLAKAATAVTQNQLTEALSGKQDNLQEGVGIVISTDNVISAPNTLTDLERLWVKEQVFIKYFTGDIVPATTSKSVLDSTVGDTVNFTLTTRLNGEYADLDTVPAGWRDIEGIGKYAMTVNTNITGSDKSIVTTGPVQLVYEGISKTITGNTITIYKPAYIVTSTNTSLTKAEIVAAIKASRTYTNSDTLTGSITVSGDDVQNHYVYFVVPRYVTINSTGVAMEASVDVPGFVIDSKNIGNYRYYRTSAVIAETSKTFTIS